MIVAIVLGVMCLCGSPILVALLLPAVQAAREAGAADAVYEQFKANRAGDAQLPRRL